TFNGVASVLALDGNKDLKMQGGAFVNVVNDKLASYFGLPSGGFPYKGGLSTFFSAPGDPPGTFSSQGFTSGSLTTSPVPDPAPSAAFPLLPGCGIVWLRRRSA